MTRLPLAALPALLIAALAGAPPAFAQSPADSASEADVVLTLEEAARYLRVPKSAVERMARQNLLPARQVGGQWRFSRQALGDWLNTTRTSASPPPVLGAVPIVPAAPAMPTTSGRVPAPRPDAGMPGADEMADIAAALAAAGSAGAPGSSANTAAAPAKRAAVATPAPAQPIGESRTAPTAEQVALRDQGVLLPAGKGSVELSLGYSHLEQTVLIDRVERNVATASVGARYGVIDDFQVSVTVPYRYVRTARYRPALPPDPAAGEVSSTAEWGDPTIALLGVALRESADRPAMIWNLQGVAPGGSGDAAIGGGFSVTRSLDPLVLFAGFNYLRGLRVDPDNPDRSFARHNLGYNFGYSLALNDAIALSGQLTGSYRNYKAGADGVPASRERYQLQFGLTWVLSPRVVIEPTVAFGIGGSTPDLTLGLNIPMSF